MIQLSVEFIMYIRPQLWCIISLKIVRDASSVGLSRVSVESSASVELDMSSGNKWA